MLLTLLFDHHLCKVIRYTLHVQVRDLQVEIAAITSQHASTLDAKRVLEDKSALMTQELNELRARRAAGASAAHSAPGELDRTCIGQM